MSHNKVPSLPGVIAWDGQHLAFCVTDEFQYSGNAKIVHRDWAIDPWRLSQRGFQAAAMFGTPTLAQHFHQYAHLGVIALRDRYTHGRELGAVTEGEYLYALFISDEHVTKLEVVGGKNGHIGAIPSPRQPPAAQGLGEYRTYTAGAEATSVALLMSAGLSAEEAVMTLPANRDDRCQCTTVAVSLPTSDPTHVKSEPVYRHDAYWALHTALAKRRRIDNPTTTA